MSRPTTRPSVVALDIPHEDATVGAALAVHVANRDIGGDIGAARVDGHTVVAVVNEGVLHRDVDATNVDAGQAGSETTTLRVS